MIFISLGRFRKKPTKEGLVARDKIVADLHKQGAKVLASYWTLGRFDFVTVIESPDKDAVQNAMKGLLRLSDNVSTETLVALRREEAVSLLD